jgi:hypothetical protein
MAAEAPLFAAPAASTAHTSGGSLFEVTLALLAIVALIAGLAWLMKRMRGFGNAGHDRIQVLSERALGPKERCCAAARRRQGHPRRRGHRQREHAACVPRRRDRADTG